MRRAPVWELRRIAALAFLTLLSAVPAWALASSAAATSVTDATEALRAAPLSRSLANVAPPDSPATLRVAAVAVPVARTDVAREAIPFAVQIISDGELLLGRVVVVRAGVAGVAENTYRILLGDDSQRTLLTSVELAPPVTEVRRVGTKPPPAVPEIETLIRAAAAAWGADEAQLLRVAWCESRYNPLAYNARSGASGLFQFMPRTWVANSARAGYAGASAFDPIANANTAAYMFRNDQAWQWTCK